MTNRLLGLFFVLFGLLLLLIVIPRHTEVVGYGWMRPRTLPCALAIVIAAAGAVLAARPRGTVDFEWRQSLRAAFYLAMVAAGVWLIDGFGFMVVAPPMALVIMLVIGERRPLWLAVGAAGIPFAIWLAVPVMLDRPLP